MQIPYRFRNVICPWQCNDSGELERGVRGQIKFVESMLVKFSPAEQEVLLGLDKPDRVWRAKGE